MIARALLLALACAASAGAEPADTLAGRWTFETSIATARNCIIAGEALLTPAATRGEYRVEMRAVETCATGHVWRSVQACTATTRGRTINVDCTLVSAEPSNYAADDFVLELRAPGLMEGSLVSTWDAPARWRRDGADLIS